jgi:hypothetical protein
MVDVKGRPPRAFPKPFLNSVADVERSSVRCGHKEGEIRVHTVTPIRVHTGTVYNTLTG